MNRLNILLPILIILSACGTSRKAYYGSKARMWQQNDLATENDIVHTLYLVGDAGKLDGPNHNRVLSAVESMLKTDEEETTLVYLGDNLYPSGLVKKKNDDRQRGQSILDAQMALAQYVEDRTVFIPGNHDWNDGKKGGLKAIKRMEKYIEKDKENGSNIRMYPSHGCADPKVQKIHKDLYFVYIDSQWWLQDWSEESEMNDGCDITTRAELLQTMREIFLDHKNDELVVLMHHPFHSNGSHGGRFSLKEHLFPLTMLNDNLYVPLPVLGSLYPLYRKVDGGRQDLQNGLYQELTKSLKESAKMAGGNVIFTAGHEHSLQYYDEDKIKYVVSGSGAKVSYAAKGNGATYSRAERGFVKITFHKNNESWIEYYVVPEGSDEPILEYRSQMRTPKAGTESAEVIYPSVHQRDTIIAVGPSKEAGKLKEAFMGEHYRNMWTEPVTVPIIDLATVKGGLTPVKRGGGMSSNSLRLQADDGKQYILRSVNKVFTRSLPDEFKNLKMIDILKDQNSAYHPYGSLVVAELSKAAGVYYTDPQVVFLKKQQQLGSYNEYFPEEIYMFEQRPNGDWSDTELFGQSKDVIGYSDLLVNLREKKSHFVDQKWTVKSRLFDLFIHDWDRHDDQWRWATFEQEDGTTLYRPIPRDRDLAFYKFDGILMSFVAEFVMTKYKTMRDNVKDVKSLTLNGKYFDRYFLNELEWSEWVPIIEELQRNITDDVIDSSGKNLPTEVRAMSDDELNDKLKGRRDNLMEIGKRFYDLISKEVEITGTDNDELFDIVGNADGTITVKYSIIRKNKGNIEKYNRTFYSDETDEVRIYGLDGDDTFTISGTHTHGINIRIIGGEGDDQIDNQSAQRDIYVYDGINGVEISGTAIKDRTSDDLEINEYDRYGFLYDVTLVAPQFHYNRDGLWLGAAYTKVNNDWRNDPYKSSNTFKFMFAPGGQDAYRVDYIGHFPDAFGSVDFNPILNVDFPKNHNFFGFGNDTELTADDLNYNWVRMNAAQLSPMLNFSRSASSHFSIGPTLETYEINDVENRIIKEDRFGFGEEIYDRKYFAGAKLSYSIQEIDNAHKPSSGVALNLSAVYLNELAGDNDHLRFDADLRLYIPLLRSPEVTVVNRFGYSALAGDAYFYQMPGLGNKQGLRGFRNDRFLGESMMYNNVDLRLKLFAWNNVILPMDVGILGGYDIGRVWYDDQPTDGWHRTQTVGLWLDVLGMAIIQPYYSWAEGEDSFSVLARFSF